MTVYDDVSKRVKSMLGAASLTRGQSIIVNDTIEAMWEVLGAADPHRANVDKYAWTVSHPLPCRLQEGGLLACPVRFRGTWQGPGTYELRADGEWVKV